ncbi:XRE family transcriptional regulator [Streptomyces armeniacus]|uniref:XRE family transcriptional regulator n=1 Tax=Streptomyces armeniacus TaxID=83291 RepID=A0A345XSS9_9ACTN|nr:helix-turn-helix transcriptional regulator [Streptomyces armeniacus]AXK34695.1 XRE family transcriptional regulator [Streptomyces armeniacus]
MITVEQWTADEALLLKSVMRQSVRDFAQRLGINPRTVSHWKNNRSAVCRPSMQQILDMALAGCTPAEQEAFRVQLATRRGEDTSATPSTARPSPCTVVAHRFLPAYVGDKLAHVYAAGLPRPSGPGGLEQRVFPGRHPSAQTSTVHAYACGIAVVHLEERVQVGSLTELAVRRYRSYARDRDWAGRRIRDLLKEHGAGQVTAEGVPDPEYVLCAYELREHSWVGEGLETALQLLATPSVLVNRQDPMNVVPLGTGVEDARFRDGWAHPEVVEFGGGVSRGIAGWSGVAYHPRPDERALTMSQIVALELDVQALWALSSHILHMIEEGHDPVMPETCGWRALRSAYVRLTTARATETAQHRMMREAILTTSELPERLRAAQDALRESVP